MRCYFTDDIPRNNIKHPKQMLNYNKTEIF